jgi:ankyrin repeat protein
MSGAVWAQSVSEGALIAAKAAIRAQDYTGALAILQAPEAQESPDVLLMQASLYQAGRGIARDNAKAYALTLLAADLGSIDAQYNLGRLLLSGRGVETDRQAGQAWVTKAAEAGHIRAAALLVNLLQSPAAPVQATPPPAPALPAVQGSDISRRFGWTPLMEAAQRGQHRLLESLIPSANINAQDTLGRTALMLAISANDLTALDMLLRAGADAEAVDNAGNTPLGYAAKSDDPLTVRILLSFGTWPDIPNSIGQTPLDIAILHQHNEIATLMLARRGLTLPAPLLHQLWFSAAKHGSESLFAALAAHGGRCDLLDANQYSAIDHAAESGNLALLRYCLNVGAPTQRLALIRAVQAGQIEFALALLAAEIDPNSESPSGNSPLLIAANMGNAVLVQALINRGADIDHRNAAGYTALMLAAQNGHTSVFSWLLTADADIGLRNKLREQAYDIALAAGHPELARMVE